jgi:hypothetical protein
MIIRYSCRRQCLIIKKKRAKRTQGRGRPATGITPMVGIRLDPEFRAEIEAWAAAQDDSPSFAEAARRLMKLGLSAGATKIPRIVASDHVLAAAKPTRPKKPART